MPGTQYLLSVTSFRSYLTTLYPVTISGVIAILAVGRALRGIRGRNPGRSGVSVNWKKVTLRSNAVSHVDLGPFATVPLSPSAPVQSRPLAESHSRSRVGSGIAAGDSHSTFSIPSDHRSSTK